MGVAWSFLQRLQKILARTVTHFLAMEYKIICPSTVTSNKNLSDMFVHYLPDDCRIINIIPELKQVNYKQAQCMWIIYFEDLNLRSPSLYVKDSFEEYLECNKPRNCGEISLKYSTNYIWKVEYGLMHCSCKSVFTEAKQEGGQVFINVYQK